MTLSTPFLVHPCVLSFRLDRSQILSFGEEVRVSSTINSYQSFSGRPCVPGRMRVGASTSIGVWFEAVALAAPSSASESSTESILMGLSISRELGRD